MTASDKMAEYIRYHACETGCLIDGPGHEDCFGCPAAEALAAHKSQDTVEVDRELLRSELVRLSMRNGIGLPFIGACEEADEIIDMLQR